MGQKIELKNTLISDEIFCLASIFDYEGKKGSEGINPLN